MTNTRIGQSGHFAKAGDIVEVVKGRKYPVGMRMVVSGFYKWKPEIRSRGTMGADSIEFIDEGFEVGRISEYNVKIIAQIEDRDENPMYGNVSSFHYDKWGNFVFDESIKEVE